MSLWIKNFHFVSIEFIKQVSIFDHWKSLFFTSAFLLLFNWFLLWLWLFRLWLLLLSSCHRCLRYNLGWRSCPRYVLSLKSSCTLGCSYLRNIFRSGLILGFNWRCIAIYSHLANRYWWFLGIGIIGLETYVASTLILKWIARSSSRLLRGSFYFLFLLRLNVCKPENSKHNNIFFQIFNEHLSHYFNCMLTAVVNHWVTIITFDNRRAILGRIEVEAILNINVSTQVFW